MWHKWIDFMKLSVLFFYCVQMPGKDREHDERQTNLLTCVNEIAKAAGLKYCFVFVSSQFTMGFLFTETHEDYKILLNV